MANNARRVVFAGPNECRIEGVDLPAPGAGEVLIRNEASLVSAGTELAMLRQRHRAFTSDGPRKDWATYPFYPGYAAVGVVETVGSGVTTLAVGDRVWHPSAHATASLVGADLCRVVPAGIEPRDAVFFALIQIALTAVRRAPVTLRERVLVSGLGLVGILCSHLFQLSGARVGAADFSPGRIERAKRQGLDPVIDLSATTLEEWYAERPELAPDLSIEAAGVEASISACLHVTRHGGRVVLQGSPRKVMEIDPYTDIHLKALTVIGAHDSSVDPATRERDVPLVFDLCAGGIDLSTVRTHEIPFEEAPALYDRLEDSLDEYLGAVLIY